MPVIELLLYIALVPIWFDGLFYAVGADLTLNVAQAKPLLDVNAIEPKKAAAESVQLQDAPVPAAEHRRIVASSNELLKAAQQALDYHLESHEEALVTIDTLTQANAALQAQIDAAAKAGDSPAPAPAPAPAGNGKSASKAGSSAS